MSTTSYATPILDSFATARKLAPVIMNNVVQRIQLSNGKGLTEKFSQDVFADEIRIIRIKPLVQKARTLGETTDGLHYSAQTVEQPISDHYGLRLRHKYDTGISIPKSMMDMIPLDLLNGTREVLEQAIAKNVNASTLATQLASALNYEYNGGTPLEDHKVEVTLGTTVLTDAIMDMGVILDGGDATNGVDTFPKEGRVLQIRPTINGYLKKSGTAVYSIGNWKGQDMLKVGALDPETVPNTHVDGYLGEIDQTDIYMTAPAIWTLAESWLDLSAGDLDEIYGIMSCSSGTGRGLAFMNSVQVIPEIRGQGVRLLPNYRWGIETWFPKSIVLLAKTGMTSVGTGALSAKGPAGN